MLQLQHKPSATGSFLTFLVLLSGIFLKHGFIADARWYWGLLFTIPLCGITAYLNNRREISIASEILSEKHRMSNN